MIMSTATPDPAEQAQGQPGRCRGCRAEILWIQMGPRADGKPGSMMPVDPDWRYGNARRNLVVIDEQGRGKLLVKPGPTVLGREPHWGACPKRKRFKKRP